MQISVSGLGKKYRTVEAVKDLEFQVNSGEIFALLGPNGAGKSSTIRMMTGLLNIDKGQILFTPTSGQPQNKLHNHQFGYLPEERGLFQEAPIQDTLVYLGQLKGMSKADAKQASQEWLEKLELKERRSDKLKTLSKGNQQKVQLISSIIHRPQVAFLDEPFSGLDPINQEKVIEILKALRQGGTTVLLSAHQMSLVEKLADRFLLMNQGRAVLYGGLGQIRDSVSLGDTMQLTMPDEAIERFKSASQDISPYISKVNQIAQNQVQVELENGAEASEVLRLILQDYPVSNLQITKPDLHQLYLHSIKGSE